MSVLCIADIECAYVHISKVVAANMCPQQAMRVLATGKMIEGYSLSYNIEVTKTNLFSVLTNLLFSLSMYEYVPNEKIWYGFLLCFVW